MSEAGLTQTSATRPWPAEQVERWAIERPIPYADNARLHSEADIDKLATSLAGGAGPTRCWSTRTGC